MELSKFEEHLFYLVAIVIILEIETFSQVIFIYIVDYQETKCLEEKAPKSASSANSKKKAKHHYSLCLSAEPENWKRNLPPPHGK